MKQSSQMTTWNVEMDTKIIHMGLPTSKEKTLKKCDMSLNVKKLVGVLASWKTWWFFKLYNIKLFWGINSTLKLFPFFPLIIVVVKFEVLKPCHILIRICQIRHILSHFRGGLKINQYSAGFE